MKPYQRYTSLLAAATIALTGSLQAQNSSSSSSSSQSSSMQSSTMDQISRVTKSSVKDQFTAKDLIGAEVYDPAGEKIGDITDIALQGALPEQLASSFNATENESSKDSTSSYNSGNETPAASSSSSSSSMGAGHMSDSHMNMASNENQNQTTVFISVGGLWGIGDDYVSVPASQLSYNSAEKRFELSASKADVVALAEQKSSAGYAAGTSSSSTTAGKQSFSDAATQIQNALESNPETSSFAYKVSVTTNGDEIELHGTVDNEQQHQKILDAARKATSKDVEDKLDVRK